MPSSILPQILLQVFFILLNAVFACAEIAVISMNDAKLAAMAAAGRQAGHPPGPPHLPARPILATIQVAITLAGFLAAPLRRITSPPPSPAFWSRWASASRPAPCRPYRW